MNAVIKFKPLLFHLAIPVVLGFAASFVSGDVRAVYLSLRLPAFAPPPVVFPIVWTILYLMMGVASYLIHTAPRTPRTDKRSALTLYGFSLAVNILWSPLFFRFKLFTFAAIWIVVIFVATALTTALFYRIRKSAGLLLAPTLAWLAFAGVLNFSIAVLN